MHQDDALIFELATNVPDLVERTMARFHVPGIVVVANGPDGARYEYAAGTDANGRTLEATSIFPIASITKLATALVILVLSDRGLLDLDAPISAVIPDAAAARAGVTARRLLSHTAGLPYDLPARADHIPLPEKWRDLAERCRQSNLVARPATMVQYSNAGYGLLAIMAERLLGGTIQDTVTSLVFQPLGIEASLGQTPDRPPVIVSDVRGLGAGTDTEPFNTTHWYELGLPWSGALATPDAALRLLRAFTDDGPSPIR